MKHAPILDVPTRLYIGGEWRDASDGAEFEVTNPATGELLATVASGTTADAIAAVDAAAAAFDDWAGRKPRERAEILRKAYELIVADKERFARLITLENGKALPD
ncbi:MAG: aldehyde dehydrogenase family protein, partial [Pseudomonadota bacterium]|nr:aldehyde dehydrogenase family protein [Pseudomonadota bacterium]